MRLLHLYHDLMNLYGDWANIKAIGLELAARGAVPSIDCISVGGEIDFGKYDFVYIGSGTERSQKACIRDIMRCKAELKEKIEAGLHILATGNAHEIFGNSITDAQGERHEALGLLDFETIQNESRVTGDCVCRASFLPDRLIGFINRSGHGQEGAIDRPFTCELGPGANDSSKAEGILLNNLLGTYMTGPVLVRNPPLLKYIADALYPGSARVSSDGDVFFKYQEAAYSIALQELSTRHRRVGVRS